MKRPVRNGFTLIELLVVVAIVGLLAGTAVGFYRNSRARALEGVLMENLYMTRVAIQNYFRDTDCFPLDLETLVEEGYLRTLPYDPVVGSSEDWNTVLSQFDDRDLCQDVGVEDLFSSSDAYARDGSRYDEW